MSNTNSTAIIAESAKFKGYIAAAGAITLPTSQIAPEIAKQAELRAAGSKTEAVTRRSTPHDWRQFTDRELVRAVELFISPDDLTIREAAISLLEVFSYTPEEVREQLASGEYFNAGVVFTGLGTASAAIAWPEED